VPLSFNFLNVYTPVSIMLQRPVSVQCTAWNSATEIYDSPCKIEDSQDQVRAAIKAGLFIASRKQRPVVFLRPA